MAQTTDQVYYSTLNTYQNIMEHFNPGLQNLVVLGSNFVKAFRTLTGAANTYFVAVGKFGEQALSTSTSQILGQILLQIADTQRELNNDLELIFRRFNDELLREMERNTQLDVDYITKSKHRFEKEHRERTQMLNDTNTELQKLERMRNSHTRDLQEKLSTLESGMESFLKNSYRLAVAEERRRYRFLVENHFHLSYYFLRFYSKAREALHNKVPGWREHTSSAADGTASGRSSPRPPNMGAPLNVIEAANVDTISRRSYLPSPQPSRREMNGGDLLPFANSEPSKPGERSPLMRLGSAGGQSQGPRGDRVAGLTGARVQAVISHAAVRNQSMLNFEKGDIVTILVPEAKNGWLFGKLEGSPKQGWFPHSFVQPFQKEVQTHEPSLRPFPMRSGRSTEDLLDPKRYMLPLVDYSSPVASVVPDPPPLPHGASRSHSPAPPDLRSRRGSAVSLAVSEGGQSRIFGGTESQHELFPRGTNPFATVKLRPTVTNDRSTPLIR
ncbi:brain-specific angiogenesis inhibitor 1-associated protein 2-like protein 2 isoform X1 [Amblyraja radiata]|uniref:brain-specific angiogenesis inhibitor 1-associated protein 2-like protein 2 isoform X1 n=1 Tax=Amblyraja radiata TaxID=386614 RepID=UPI001401D9F6|nr:brain-specific angiogenesis inhibitor 1-associated protein 2-like protein 2 isoform X1 [Amblyraja radiata]